MIRAVLLVGGFFGGLACFVAGAYFAFGIAGALFAAGVVLLFVSFVASLGDDEGAGALEGTGQDTVDE